jgi:hypothetical protein
MLATLKSILFGKESKSQNARLGVEALETRVMPCARIPQLYHYTGVEGVAYKDQLVATYQMPANMSAADYQVFGFDRQWHWQPAHVEQKGQTLIVRSDLERDNEGSQQAAFHIVRIRDHTQVAWSIATLDALNAALSAMSSAPALNAVVGQDSGRLRLATFIDTRPATTTPGVYHALINWGDGRTTAGEVLVSGGSVEVFGSHTYSVAVPHRVTVTLREGDFAAGTLFCSTTHTIRDAIGASRSVGGLATSMMTIHVASHH